jgi:MFS family permease
MEDLLLKKESSSESNIKSDNKNNPNILISKSDRWYVYTLLVISNIFIQMDHGSIPASTWNLYKIFNSNQEIGLFGSFVFIGNLVGALIYFYLINIYQRKKLLINSMFLISICLITFILTTNTLFLLLNRGILGIFQSYFVIYLPLWCNQYGITNQRSIMLSIGQLTTPLGVFVGYLIASECISINEDIGWKFSFVIQSVIIIIMIFLLFRVSESLFETKYVSYKDERNITDVTFFKLSESIIIDQDTNISDIINISYFKQIFSHKVYVLSILSISCLYYAVTGVQYWAGDYMNRILKVHSPQKRLLYFSIICFTSPTLGVICAGYSVNRLKHGYNNIRVYNYCFVLSIFTFVTGIISAFMSKLNLFILFTWLAFFFGGAIMPILTGIIITSLPQHLRASGNSLQLFFGTLLGYLPAPYIYGALEDYFDDGGKKSYFSNMVVLFLCVILLGYSRKIKYEKIEDDNEYEIINNLNEIELINLEENGNNLEQVPIK